MRIENQPTSRAWPNCVYKKGSQKLQCKPPRFSKSLTSNVSFVCACKRSSWAQRELIVIDIADKPGRLADPARHGAGERDRGGGARCWGRGNCSGAVRSNLALA